MNFLTQLSSGITTLIPSVASAAYSGFEALFLNVGETSVTLNPLGDVAVAFIVYRLAVKFIPMIANWLQLRAKNVGTGGKKRRRA